MLSTNALQASNFEEENSNFHPSLVCLTCSCWICHKPLPDGHTWLRHPSACSVRVHWWVCLHLHMPPWLLWRWACLWGWVVPFAVFFHALYCRTWLLIAMSYSYFWFKIGKICILCPVRNIVSSHSLLSHFWVNCSIFVIQDEVAAQMSVAAVRGPDPHLLELSALY